jgi:hypothetical protein
MATSYELQSTASVTVSDVAVVKAAMETSFSDSSFGSYSVRNLVITDQARRLKEQSSMSQSQHRELVTVVWEVSCDVNIDITTTAASTPVELKSLIVGSLNSLTFKQELGSIAYDNTTLAMIAATRKPTTTPTHEPTHDPTKRPTLQPTYYPSHVPTKTPTLKPSVAKSPSPHPTPLPTPRPSISGTHKVGFSILTLGATMSIAFIGGVVFLCFAAGGAWLVMIGGVLIFC